MSHPDPGGLDSRAFWEFSLAYYSREKVAAACLSLQNRRGADVNIMLLCCWLATLDRHVEEAGLQAAVAAVEGWRREVIEPLRSARHAVAERFPELANGDRQSIKHELLSAELECERIAQERICAAVAPLVSTVEAPNARDIAGSSIEVYLGLVIPEPDDTDAADLEALIAPL